MVAKYQWPIVSKSEINIVNKVLKSNKLNYWTGHKCLEFENKFSEYFGLKHAISLANGSVALDIAIKCLELKKDSEIIVTPRSYISSVTSVLNNNLKPVFADIDLNSQNIEAENIKKKITNKTKAIFLSHIQGFNALTNKILQIVKKKNIFLIEDVCESHGASFKNKKLGTFGWTSNFSFYYAHHLTTIEGGMVCTNSKEAYQILLKLRSHGLARESNDLSEKKKIIKKYKNLNSDFIFQYAAYNVRNTELGAILGINQLKKLNQNIKKRNRNNKYFLSNLNSKLFYTEFDLSGSSNYAFNLILKPESAKYVEKLKTIFKKNSIEFRQGSAGGGNQLRQPYLSKVVPKNFYKRFKNTEHIHKFGFYIGNFPELSIKDVNKICVIANSLIKYI